MFDVIFVVVILLFFSGFAYMAHLADKAVAIKAAERRKMIIKLEPKGKK
jgi:hypothetical protein